MSNITVTTSNVDVSVAETVSNITVTDTLSNVVVTNVATAVANITVSSTETNVNVSQSAVVSNAAVRTKISVSNESGFGNLAYDSTVLSNGVIQYTGVSSSDIRNQFTGGYGITYTNGTGEIETANADIRDLFSVNDTGGFGSLSYNDANGNFAFTGTSEADVRGTISATLPVTYNSSTGVIGFDQNLSNLTLQQFQETVVSNGNQSGAVTLDISQGTLHTMTLTNDVTGFTFSDLQGGGSLVMYIDQDNVGGHELDITTTPANWTNWYWIGNNKIIDTTPNAKNVIAIVNYGTTASPLYSASVLEYNASPSTITVNGTTIDLGASGNITTQPEDLTFTANTLIMQGNDGGDGGTTDNGGVIEFTKDSFAVTSPQGHIFKTGDNKDLVFSSETGYNFVLNNDIPVAEAGKSFDIRFYNENNPSLFSVDDFGNVTIDLKPTGPTPVTSEFKIGHSLSSGSATDLFKVDGTGNITAGVNSTNLHTFTGNTTIAGNLTVDGNIDYINVVDLLVNDKSITLNYGNVAQDAQIIVDRTGASGSNVDIKWNETTDKWQFTNDGSTYQDIGSFVGSTTDDIPQGTNNIYFSTSGAAVNTDNLTEGTNNLYYTTTRFDTDFGNKTTTDLAEGTNLYFTNARADARVNALLPNTDFLTEGSTNLYYTDGRFDTRLATKSTTDLAEGTNLYYTTARQNSDFDLRFATKNTTNLPEGTNLYYTDARSRAAVSVTTATPSGDGALSYNNSTGVFTFTPADAGESDYGNVEVADFLANGFGSNTITTTGTIEAGLFEGDINGAVLLAVHNNTSTRIDKGNVVYLPGGNNGDNPYVDNARADSATTMPAFGIAFENINASSPGEIVTLGELTGLDMTGFTTGDHLFVSPTTAGAFQNTAPTSEAHLLQSIGKVVKGGGPGGALEFTGAGRTNATPNLDEGNIFVGDTNNQSVTADLNNFTYEIKSSANIESTQNTIGSNVAVRDTVTTGSYLSEVSLSDTYNGNLFGGDADHLYIDIGAGGNTFIEAHTVPFQISFDGYTGAGESNLNGVDFWLNGSDQSGGAFATYQVFTDSTGTTPASISTLGISPSNGGGSETGNVLNRYYAVGAHDITESHADGIFNMTGDLGNIMSYNTVTTPPREQVPGGTLDYVVPTRFSNYIFQDNDQGGDAGHYSYVSSSDADNNFVRRNGVAKINTQNNSTTSLNKETGFQADQAGNQADTLFSIPRFAMRKYNDVADFTSTSLGSVGTAMPPGSYAGVIDSKINKRRGYTLASNPDAYYFAEGAAPHTVGSILFTTDDSNVMVSTGEPLNSGSPYATRAPVSNGIISFRTMQTDVAINSGEIFPYNTATDSANSTVAYINDKFNIGNEEDSTKAYSFPKLPGANNTVLVMDTNNDLQFEDFEAKMDGHFEDLLRKYIGTINFVDGGLGNISGGAASTTSFAINIDGGNA